MEIYQSSFDDGGSRVKLKAIAMGADVKPFEIEGTIGGSSELMGSAKLAEKLTLEYAGLRVINVENFAAGAAGLGASGTDVRKVDLRQAIDARLGSAHKTTTQKELRNVGPSVNYKLRDASGQAREYQNYMLPVKMDASPDSPALFLLGVRDTPADAFQYLRIPADPEGGMQTFLQVRAALADPVRRDLAVARYSAQAMSADRPELAFQLAESASKALALFAGADAAPEVGKNAAKANSVSGLQAISDFMEVNVPAGERDRAGEVLVRILNGTLFELTQMTRKTDGLPPLVQDDTSRAFMAQVVLSLSDAFHYPAPLSFQLVDFTQVQASVFQVARAPGKTIVYLGCAFLILGIFAMLYVRERRVWVWLAPVAGGGDDEPASSHATMALSTNRKTMDGDREFDMLTTKLLQVAA